MLNVLDEVENQWDKVLPHILDYNYTVDDTKKSSLARKLKQFYFGQEELSRKNFNKFIKVSI